MAVAKLVGKWCLRLVLAGALGLVLAATVVLVVLPRATHGTAMTVLTGSMSPGIPVGSVVIDRPVDPGTLHVGDIATYQKTPGVADYITHRIVKIDASKSPVTFTFKGDANRGPDLDPVPASAIRGKVWFHVPYLGAIRDAIHTKGGIAGVGMVVLAIYAGFQLVGGLKQRRRPTPHAAPAIGGGSETADWHIVREQLSHDTTEPMMILATLPTAAFADLSPRDVARMLRGTLVSVTDKTFTILAVEDPTQAGDTVIVAHELAHPAFQFAGMDLKQPGDGSMWTSIDHDEMVVVPRRSHDRTRDLVASDVER